MVQASQPQTHHQNHWQVQTLGEVGAIESVAQRNTKAACALDHHHIRLQRQGIKRRDNPRQFDIYARTRGSDMRRNRRLKAIWIDERTRRNKRAGRIERSHIFIQQPLGIMHRTGGHRLHADGTHAAAHQRTQQRASDPRFADPRIGAGDKKTARRDGHNNRHRRDQPALIGIIGRPSAVLRGSGAQA